MERRLFTGSKQRSTNSTTSPTDSYYSTPLATTMVTVNGHGPVPAVVDTGTTINFIPMSHLPQGVKLSPPYTLTLRINLEARIYLDREQGFNESTRSTSTCLI